MAAESTGLSPMIRARCPDAQPAALPVPNSFVEFPGHDTHQPHMLYKAIPITKDFERPTAC